jgi:hypothetical protein
MQNTEKMLGQWISVEEHLPESGVTVLVFGLNRSMLSGSSSGEIGMGVFNPRGGWVSGLTEVHFWTDMPSLPNLTKNEDED